MMTTEGYEKLDHDRWVRQIDALFRGELSPEDAAPLYEHVRACASCEKAYERYASAERALYKTNEKQPINRAANERVLQRIIADVVDDSVKEASWSLARFWKPLAFAGVAAALMVGLVFTYPITDQHDFQARGGKGIELTSEVTMRGLRIRKEGEEVAVTELSGELPTVAAGDHIKLLYTNLKSFRTLTVAVSPRDGNVLTKVQAEIQPGVEDASFKGSIAVPPDWPKGPVRIIGAFTDEVDPQLDQKIGTSKPFDGEHAAVRILYVQIGERTPEKVQEPTQ
jgi:hypothetical protein